MRIIHHQRLSLATDYFLQSIRYCNTSVEHLPAAVGRHDHPNRSLLHLGNRVPHWIRRLILAGGDEQHPWHSCAVRLGAAAGYPYFSDKGALQGRIACDRHTGHSSQLPGPLDIH